MKIMNFLHLYVYAYKSWSCDLSIAKYIKGVNQSHNEGVVLLHCVMLCGVFSVLLNF